MALGKERQEELAAYLPPGFLDKYQWIENQDTTNVAWDMVCDLARICQSLPREIGASYDELFDLVGELLSGEHRRIFELAVDEFELVEHRNCGTGANRRRLKFKLFEQSLRPPRSMPETFERSASWAEAPGHLEMFEN